MVGTRMMAGQLKRWRGVAGPTGPRFDEDSGSTPALPGCILTGRMSAAPRPSRSKPRIVETPGVCGGYPRIWNTRISVGLVVEAYHNTDGSFDRTASAFPQ